MGAALAVSGCSTTSKTLVAAAAAPAKPPREAKRAASTRRPSANEKINIAGIGIGGQGHEDMKNCEEHNVVALCDVDWAFAGRTFRRFPNAKQYKDFRVMLEKQKGIDAVVIATPDHTHAIAAMTAIQLGKHVYCEKPLTYSVEESRKLAAAAREAKIATQMGNSGQAKEEVRVTAEYVLSGAIGPVREVHVWSDRPIWPQGIGRPSETQPVPETLDWDLWLGVAPERPFNGAYHPFKWRGWRDFGTGALGDMGCHAFHPIFRVLKLGHPTSVEACSSDKKTVSPETYPLASIVRYQFPAREDMPPLALTWYDGGLRPARPPELEEERALEDGGTLYVGDKGKMLGHIPIPEARRKELGQPPKTLPRSPGHFQEWFQACKGGEPAGANFDIASLVTQTVLLGNIALRTGKQLIWDGNQITNDPEANQFLTREYRAGWSV
jgi:predicted dehydrogenase